MLNTSVQWKLELLPYVTLCRDVYIKTYMQGLFTWLYAYTFFQGLERDFVVVGFY